MTGSSTSQYIKERNLNHIYNIIKREKAISRVEIARKINLSQTAVGRLVADLIGAGYVREGTNVGNSVGRQRVQLHLVPERVLVIGIYIHSDCIDVGLVDAMGEVSLKSVYKMDDFTPVHVVNQIREVTDSLLNQMSPQQIDNLVGIGISLPGSVDYRTGHVISTVPSLGWSNVNLGSMLKISYNFNIAIDSGSKSYAKAHYLDMPEGTDEFLLFQLGENIALVEMIHSKLSRGIHNLAGEIGHITTDPNVRPSNGESEKSLGNMVSKHAIEKRLGISFAEAVKRYRENDPVCVAALNEVVNTLAMWVANFFIIFDLPEIILTGSMLDEWEEMFDLVKGSCRRFLFGRLAEDYHLNCSELKGMNNNIVAAASNIFYKSVIKDLKNTFDVSL